MLSWLNQSTPLEMSSAEPPLLRLANITPFRAALASVGFPFNATAFLNFGSINWLSEVIVPNFAESYPTAMKPP